MKSRQLLFCQTYFEWDDIKINPRKIEVPPRNIKGGFFYF